MNPNGEAASMDLAFATGHGPALLADLEGRGPLVHDEDAFLFGFRDADEQAEYGSQPLPPGLRAFDLVTVRRMGVETAPLPVEDKGTLVILTPERLTPSNPEHVALARRVQNLLEERGLLRLVVQPPPIRQA